MVAISVYLNKDSAHRRLSHAFLWCILSHVLPVALWHTQNEVIVFDQMVKVLPDGQILLICDVII